MSDKPTRGSRLRVLHVLEVFSPDYGGGAAVTTREVCQALAARGHDVRVLCVEGREGAAYSLRREDDGPVRVARVNLPYLHREDPEGWRLGIVSWWWHERRVSALLRRLLREWRPQLVDYHTARPLGETCLRTIAGEGIPLVATLHDYWLICPRVMLMRSPGNQVCEGPKAWRCLACLYSEYDGSRLRAAVKLPWRLARLGVYRAYRIWRRRRACACVSAAIGRSAFVTAAHRPFLRGELSHIALGIDLAGKPTRAVAAPNPLRFGFVAGSQPTKGLELLLEAAAALAAKDLVFELHVWGPVDDALKRRITGLGLKERVRVRGMYRTQDRWQAYGEMDVAVMATVVCEPLGRVPLEAAAAGVPTIAPAVGGIVESIRDGVDGLLYEFRSAAGLEARMERVLREPALLARLRSQLRPPGSTAAAVIAVEDLYYRVVEAPAGLAL